MHLHFEKNTDTKCDCSILSLSWMGKVPDDIPEVSFMNETKGRKKTTISYLHYPTQPLDIRHINANFDFT